MGFTISGFDSEPLRQACKKEKIIVNVKPNPRNSKEKERELAPIGTTIFDDELNKNRSVIEHSNAWIDDFKALFVRFEFSVKNWTVLHFIVFSVIFLLKINKKSLNGFYICNHSTTSAQKFSECPAQFVSNYSPQHKKSENTHKFVTKPCFERYRNKSLNLSNENKLHTRMVTNFCNNTYYLVSNT